MPKSNWKKYWYRCMRYSHYTAVQSFDQQLHPFAPFIAWCFTLRKSSHSNDALVLYIKDLDKILVLEQFMQPRWLYSLMSYFGFSIEKKAKFEITFFSFFSVRHCWNARAITLIYYVKVKPSRFFPGYTVLLYASGGQSFFKLIPVADYFLYKSSSFIKL